MRTYLHGLNEPIHKACDFEELGVFQLVTFFEI